MSDVQNSEGPRGNRLRPVIWGVALIGVAAFLYVIVAATFKPSDDGGLIAYRRGALAKLEIPGELKPRDERQPEKAPEVSPPGAVPPELPLVDATGKTVTLSDYRGSIVVLNFWATWCAPCKAEMPELNALAAAYAVQPVKVLAVSIDRDQDRPKAAQEITKYPAMVPLYDDMYKLAFGLAPPIKGPPTTIIFDRKGVERARVSGPADWNSKDARALVEALLKE